VKAHLIPCTETSLDIFDKLREAAPAVVEARSWLVRKDVSCGEDVEGGRDRLHQLMLDEHNSSHPLSKLEQQEFIWRLFKHIVLGGDLNQYEDDADKYRQAVRTLYKMLIRCSTMYVAKRSKNDQANATNLVCETLQGAKGPRQQHIDCQVHSRAGR
jgi:hypothetical protein